MRIMVLPPLDSLQTATARPAAFMATCGSIPALCDGLERSAGVVKAQAAGRLDRSACDGVAAAVGGEYDRRAAVAVDRDVGRRAEQAKEVTRLRQTDVLRRSQRAAGGSECSLDHLRAAAVVPGPGDDRVAAGICGHVHSADPRLRPEETRLRPEAGRGQRPLEEAAPQRARWLPLRQSRTPASNPPPRTSCVRAVSSSVPPPQAGPRQPRIRRARCEVKPRADTAVKRR